MISVRIEEKKEFKVYGIKTFIHGQNTFEFVSFWSENAKNGMVDQLKALSAPVKDTITNSRILGISRVEKDPQNRSFEFFLAVESKEELNLESFIVAGGLWAIFRVDGDTPSDFIRAELEAFKNWLPHSEYEHDYRPELEVYPEEEGKFVEFWLPIRKKKIL